MNLTMKRKNKGFTLLEIIIVVIIVGVLASLALPRLFSTVEFSRSTEALAAIGTVRAAMERCMARVGGTGNYVVCDNIPNEINDIPDPSTEVGRHFTYAMGGSLDGYTIVATRNTLDGGATTSIVSITLSTTTTSIKKGGATAFVNL